MSTQTVTLNSIIPDTLTPAQQQIFDELSRESAGWMGHEKYYSRRQEYYTVSV